MCAGVAQLGEQQTEDPSILEVPCSIHGPGIFFFYIQDRAYSNDLPPLVIPQDAKKTHGGVRAPLCIDCPSVM